MTQSIELLNSEFTALRQSERDLPLPPPCFVSMQGEFIDYQTRSMLQARFPVLREYTNPVGTMQGGFVSAAMDNVLGPLSYLAARRICVTLDLSTQFIRGVEVDDLLTITAKVVSRSRAHILMTAEGVNAKGKLIATATSTVLIVEV